MAPFYGPSTTLAAVLSLMVSASALTALGVKTRKPPLERGAGAASRGRAAATLGAGAAASLPLSGDAPTDSWVKTGTNLFVQATGFVPRKRAAALGLALVDSAFGFGIYIPALGLALVDSAYGFGAYIPDDDPEEPDRTKDCEEFVNAEECRAAGCMYDKPKAECKHWPLKNSKGKPTPPDPPTSTPTTSPTFSPTPV